MPSIYDELVASSSALYGAEKAVETEQKKFDMWRRDRLIKNEKSIQRKNIFNARIASLLGFLSRGYKEVMDTKELDKSFEEMSKDPDFGVTPERWKGLTVPERYALKHDWEMQKMKRKWYDAWNPTSTPMPEYKDYKRTMEFDQDYWEKSLE